MNESMFETQREELVKFRIKEMMSGKFPDELNYNPFDIKNMAEFMQEMQVGWVARLCDLAKDSKYGLSYERDHKEKLLGSCLIDMAEQYWTELATAKAEEETPSVRELRAEYLSEIAEQHDSTRADNERQ